MKIQFQEGNNGPAVAQGFTHFKWECIPPINSTLRDMETLTDWVVEDVLILSTGEILITLGWIKQWETLV